MELSPPPVWEAAEARAWTEWGAAGTPRLFQLEEKWEKGQFNLTQGKDVCRGCMSEPKGF